MGFIVEKQGLTGLYFHYSRTFEQWIFISDEMSESTAKEKCIILSEKEKGTYRVRSIWDSKISFKIKT